jgi:transcription initiation factor TFIIIB Brf1 subunit/transcription initiation factor TFIIB
MDDSDFNLFNQVLTEYQENIPPISETEKPVECTHENVVFEKSVCICVNCGIEIQEELIEEKEWRYQTNNYVTDMNKVQMRKQEERSIRRDVENLGFSENIIAYADELYKTVTKEKIFRGNSRKAIIFACIFNAFKKFDKPQSHESLIQTFNLKKKVGLKGLKQVNLALPKDYKSKISHIKVETIIDEIMTKFAASPEQKSEVQELYTLIKNKSSKINRSRPQSIASGIVFFWICLKGKNINLKEFAKRVCLSELTINKIIKEINEVISAQKIE